jgi:hypothetical protein
MRVPLSPSVMIVLLLSSIVLIGCGVRDSAVARPPGAPAPTSSEVIILPTAPPMPTSALPPPTPTVPPPPAQAAPAGAASLLNADFGPGASLAQWQVIDTASALPGPSIWRLRDGRLSPISDAGDLPSMYGTALVSGDTSWRDYSVTVAAYNIDNEVFGVVARASEQGFYVFHLLPGGTAALLRYDGSSGAFKNLAKADVKGIAPRQWMTLRLQVHGDRISAFVSGQQVLQASDATLGQGQAGVYGYAMGGLEFDNLSVQTLAGQ